MSNNEETNNNQSDTSTGQSGNLSGGNNKVPDLKPTESAPFKLNLKITKMNIDEGDPLFDENSYLAEIFESIGIYDVQFKPLSDAKIDGEAEIAEYFVSVTSEKYDSEAQKKIQNSEDLEKEINKLLKEEFDGYVFIRIPEQDELPSPDEKITGKPQFTSPFYKPTKWDWLETNRDFVFDGSEPLLDTVRNDNISTDQEIKDRIKEVKKRIKELHCPFDFTDEEINKWIEKGVGATTYHIKMRLTAEKFDEDLSTARTLTVYIS